METAKWISLVLHVIAGISTLIAGPIAIYFNYRQTEKHKTAGKVFFYAMLVACLTGTIGWLKRPDMVFYQFLGALSLMVAAQMFVGIRAIIIRKERRKSWMDYFALSLLVTAAVLMLVKGASIFVHTQSPLAILFLVFGIMSAFDAFRQIKRLTHFSAVPSLEWYKLHIGTMLGGFTASTTAFLVNVGQFLPWYLQWSLPTILLVPVSVYFQRKIGQNQ